VTSKHAKDTESSVDSIIDELLESGAESDAEPAGEAKPDYELALETAIEAVSTEAEEEIAEKDEVEDSPFSPDSPSSPSLPDSSDSPGSPDDLIASLLSDASAKVKSEREGAIGVKEAGASEETGGSGTVAVKDVPALLPHIIEFPEKRPVWPLFISALVLLIVLTGALTYYNKTTLADQAAAAALVQQDGDALLYEAIALIQESDTVIVTLDQAIAKQVTDADVPRLEALLDQVETMQASLDTASDKATQAKATFVDPARQELAQHAIDSADYRKEILVLSTELVVYDIAATKSARLLDDAWSLIVDADADMRSAVEAVIVGGSDAVSQSFDYNQAAVEKLTQAEEKLASASATFTGVDLKALTDYLVVKKASAELALASDQAFLDGYVGEANALNDEFIAKDAEAVELAAKLPPDPMTPLRTAYDEAVKQLREDYTEVRSRAADADAFLRAYLGVGVQVGLEDAPSGTPEDAAVDAAVDAQTEEAPEG
jgi:hypothetical protein